MTRQEFIDEYYGRTIGMIKSEHPIIYFIIIKAMGEYAGLKTKKLKKKVERLKEILNEHKGIQKEQDENEMDMYYHELDD